MSINRWVDKEVMVHNFNGILLSYKKEHIWVSSTEVAEPKAYTKWSKPEREKQISYINTYAWNLKDGTAEPICRFSGHSGRRRGKDELRE